jgi:hypothetical protein
MKKITGMFMFWKQKDYTSKMKILPTSRNVFELCNEMGIKKAWKELGLDFPDKKVNFQVIFEDEWQNKINKIFE